MKDQRRAGRFAFFRQLMADGIYCMFGNPGSSEENLLDVLSHEEFKDFKYYMALHEGPAVAVADAYSRASGKPAVAQLHSYAGLANGLGMMYYAKRGYTPLVVVAGEAGIKYEAMDGQMAADLVAMARPFVKSDYNGPCAWRVASSNSLLRLLRRAVKTAMTPPLGPVFLSLPMDVLEEINTEEVVPTSLIDCDVSPPVEMLERAAELLVNAQNPLILIGDGIAAAGASEALASVAESLGVDVYGVNNSEVNMPASHPLYKGDTGHMFGEDSQKVTLGRDVVLVVGTTLMPEVFPLTENVFSSDAKLIHFDLNTYEIGKNFPVEIGGMAHPRRALSGLLVEIKKRGGRRGTMREKAVEEDKSLNDGELSASLFARELRKYLPDNAVVFDEALTYSSDIVQFLDRDEPGRYFQTRAGMLGTGLPGAIGLKMAFPAAVVVGFAGDGGAISTIQALNMAARYQIGAKFVVCNNRSYRILKYNIRRYWKDLGEDPEQSFPPEFDLTGLDFVKLSEGQGVPAARIERAEEIEPVLKKAFQAEGPFLIELRLSDRL